MIHLIKLVHNSKTVPKMIQTQILVPFLWVELRFGHNEDLGGLLDSLDVIPSFPLGLCGLTLLLTWISGFESEQRGNTDHNLFQVRPWYTSVEIKKKIMHVMSFWTKSDKILHSIKVRQVKSWKHWVLNCRASANISTSLRSDAFRMFANSYFFTSEQRTKHNFLASLPGPLGRSV